MSMTTSNTSSTSRTHVVVLDLVLDLDIEDVVLEVEGDVLDVVEDEVLDVEDLDVEDHNCPRPVVLDVEDDVLDVPNLVLDIGTSRTSYSTSRILSSPSSSTSTT